MGSIHTTLFGYYNEMSLVFQRVTTNNVLRISIRMIITLSSHLLSGRFNFVPPQELLCYT